MIFKSAVQVWNRSTALSVMTLHKGNLFCLFYVCLDFHCALLMVWALSVMTLLMGPSITIKCQEVMFSRQYQDQNSNLWTWRGPSRPTLNYFCQTKFHLTHLLKSMSHLLDFFYIFCTVRHQIIFLKLEAIYFAIVKKIHFVIVLKIWATYDSINLCWNVNYFLSPQQMTNRMKLEFYKTLLSHLVNLFTITQLRVFD